MRFIAREDTGREQSESLFTKKFLGKFCKVLFGILKELKQKTILRRATKFLTSN